MSQNAMFNQRNASTLDEQLYSIMESIHQRCVDEGKSEGDAGSSYVDYMKGANVAAFRRLADAMVAQGVYPHLLLFDKFTVLTAVNLSEPHW